MTMNIDRDQAQLQTISNLVTAGVLKQDEVKSYNKVLSAMTREDVLAVLLESHQLREDCPNPIPYCPVGEICEN